MQLSFDFPFQDKYLLDDFIVSSCNQTVFEFVENYDFNHQNLPQIFAVIAPKFAGKTYLANIWAKKFAGEFLMIDELENVNLSSFIKARKFYILEDVDAIKNQELLLQIFNLVQEKSAFLFLTSTIKLGKVGLKIKDLNSRLKNVFTLEIKKPDDHLIKMLLIKNFSAKQLKVNNKVIDFLAKNLQRNFATIFDLVKLLEFYSLEKKRNITIPLVREVIKNQPIDL